MVESNRHENTYKFMFIIPTLANGGAERVVSVLSTALTEIGSRVVVVKYFDVNNEYEIGNDVKIMNLSGGNLFVYRQIRTIEKLKKLRDIIKKEKPDFIIPFLFQVALTTKVASIGLRVENIQSIRINPAKGPVKKWERIIRDWLVYTSNCTFVQNEDQKQYFKHQHHHKIHVLYNPVSDSLLSAKHKEHSEVFSICALGRLVPQKNYYLLINAFEKAFSTSEQVKLYIYGEGEEKERLVSYIHKKQLENRVQLMGRTNKVAEVLTSTDLFVLSSDWEGMPNSLIEAMACAVPCISTACPTGPSDLIQDGVNGFLVPVDNCDEMAKALRTTYEMSPEKRKVMGENARRTIREKCSAHTIARTLREMCSNIRGKGASL